MSTRLRTERTRRGWSQSDLANLIGLYSPSTVARWEGGSRRPYKRHADKLEALFGLSVDALLTNENDPR